MGIYLFCYAHGNECTWIHDVIRDTLATIVQDASSHVGQEQIYVFPSNTFNSFCWWVDIVLFKNDICTLVDVVIVDPTWVDLLPQSCTAQGFVTSNAVQAKK
jgi:hypothetical protein